ncbi:HyaD/HybD family hydrogenase maturation endopeptidase [Thiolapillus sp.]
MESTLILGIGNTLLRDEGVGVHVIRYLKQQTDLPADAVLADGGTLSFSLVADIEDHDRLIVIDATELGAEPGTIRCLENESMDSFLGGIRRSVHEVSLLDLMDMARLTGTLPQRRALFGIQPEVVDWGHQLSPRVETAVPKVAEQVLKLVDIWTMPHNRQIQEGRS